MPKAQKLAQLSPNKAYSIEGTLKFVHESEDFTTAVIQQDSVQKKIKIPACEKQLQEGKYYKFKNCFYNSNDWLMVRKPEQSIQPVKSVENEEQNLFVFTLKEIKQNFDSLSTKYFSTFLKVYAIQPKQTLKKEGKDIQYQVLKTYSTDCLIDVTIWNGEINVDHTLNQWVLFEGMRTKKMTEEKFVLVSTVFTRVSIYEWEINDWFNSEMISTYHNLSEIYQRRHLVQLQQMEIPENKIFSVIKAKVKSIVSTDYEGCPKCRRKIQNHCENCGILTKVSYSYGKVMLSEGEATLEVIVFDQKIRELFRFAKENCSIEGKIKTFGRVEEGEDVISHILTKIDSIFF